MWFKHRAWIPVAGVLSILNLVSVWFAARSAEPLHATLHALLATSLGLGALHLSTRQRTHDQAEQLQQTVDQAEQLQQTSADLQAHLLEIEERLDFTERMLVKQENAGHPVEPRR